MTGELEEKPRRRLDLRPERRGRDVVLIDSSGAEICCLNETAFALWQLCDGATSGAEISTAVSEAAGLDEPRAQLDVATALEELQRSGALG